MVFKPHITVACIVHAENHFLVVEEIVNGKPTWNQPAGHLEANESIIDAAKRELYEETGIDAPVQSLLKIHQWIAPDNTPFIRFLFIIELDKMCETHPQDSDIECCHWVTDEAILNSSILRSPLVRESILSYRYDTSLPLSILDTYGDGF